MLIEKIRKLKEKKGFTLVELIVVLVILAILAALLIPALTGYIDKANQEAIKAKTRMLVMATQTELSTAYGAGELTKAQNWVSGEGTAEEKAHYASVIKLTEDTELGKATDGAPSFKVEATTNGTITSVTYYDGSKFTCTYSGDPKGYKVDSTNGKPLDNTIKIT